MRRPSFLVPLVVAVLVDVVWHPLRGIAAIAVVTLAYLHWRFDLSDLGLRSKGWRGDAVAIAFLALLGIAPAFGHPATSGLAGAVLAAADRLFANPASFAENLFYFGFVTERLSYRAGRWLTPPLIGAMYTAHEMSNPEYWYEHMAFGFVFVGVSLMAAVYLWRRSVVVIWLGDGLRSFVGALV